MAKDLTVPHPQSNSATETASKDEMGSLLILNQERLSPSIWMRVKAGTGVYPGGVQRGMSWKEFDGLQAPSSKLSANPTFLRVGS